MVDQVGASIVYITATPVTVMIEIEREGGRQGGKEAGRYRERLREREGERD